MLTNLVSKEELKEINKDKQLKEYLVIVKLEYQELILEIANGIAAYCNDTEVNNLEDIIDYYCGLVNSQGGELKIIHMPTQTLVYQY